MVKDAEMIHLESDIQKIQVKTNMYIQEYGQQGTFHLAREIMQNSIDECLDENSQGKTIEFRYDTSTGMFTSEDDGRGFNESKYPMNVFVETLQSGSKFFRSGTANSSGEFGVGLTVVNALSTYFKIESFRENEKTRHTIEYNEGVKVKDKISPNKSGKHGTIVSFIPSEKYMGSDCKLPIEDVVKWIDSLFYLDSTRLAKKKITCKFLIYNGLELSGSHKFKPKPFENLLDEFISDDTDTSLKKSDFSSKMVISGDKIFTEDSKNLVENKDGTVSVKKVPTKKNIHLDIALRYITNPDFNNPVEYLSYCNYTNTINHGIHKNAFDECYCRFMANAVNDTLSESKKEKFKVTWDDIRTNLFCVINLSSNAAVGFVGNAKTEIGNEQLVPYLKELDNELIDNYFKANPDVLNEFVKIIKLNAKTRIEAQKIKTASQTERLNTFKEHELKNYIRCNNTGKQWKELFICEGDSASGSISNARDPDTQAVFLLRGVVQNAVKADSFAETMENNEWKNLVNILKCGAGPSFNLDKLYFNRINILTDADVDGYYISAGILAFFYMYLRPIIETGKLYKVYSPLYSLKDSDQRYASNKSELINIYHKKIVKNYKIKLIHDDSFMTKDEFKEFLSDTYDYRVNLINAAKQSGNVNKFLVELIIATLVSFNAVEDENHFKDSKELFSNQKFITKFMSIIQKKFKEIIATDDGRLSGPIDGKLAVIRVDDRFYKKVADLIPVYKKYGLLIDVKEKDKDPVRMTIGEFLDNCEKLTPTIENRFKGLGEVNGDQLHETTMDINNRVSIQYTVDDVKKELGIFDITHGGKKKDAELRKVMMKEYKIKRDDLDN